MKVFTNFFKGICQAYERETKIRVASAFTCDDVFFEHPTSANG